MKNILEKNKTVFILSAIFLVATTGTAGAVNANKTDVENKKYQMDQTKDDRRAEIQGELCERISEVAGKIQENLQTRNEKQIQLKEKNETRLQTKLQEREEKLSQRRVLRDQNREEFFLKLQERAKNQNQEDAAIEFKDTIEKAVETRRDLVDEALSAFHDGVQEAIASRNASNEALLAEYKKNREQISAEIKGVCENGGNAVQARQSLQSKLKVAKDDFKTDREEIVTVGEKVKELVQIKNAAIRAASEAFVSDVKSAQDKFNSEFEIEN
jgi:hypothetical protein